MDMDFRNVEKIPPSIFDGKMKDIEMPFFLIQSAVIDSSNIVLHF